MSIEALAVKRDSRDKRIKVNIQLSIAALLISVAAGISYFLFVQGPGLFGLDKPLEGLLPIPIVIIGVCLTRSIFIIVRAAIHAEHYKLKL